MYQSRKISWTWHKVHLVGAKRWIIKRKQLTNGNSHKRMEAIGLLSQNDHRQENCPNMHLYTF